MTDLLNFAPSTLCVCVGLGPYRSDVRKPHEVECKWFIFVSEGPSSYRMATFTPTYIRLTKGVYTPRQKCRRTYIHDPTIRYTENSTECFASDNGLTEMELSKK